MIDTTTHSGPPSGETAWRGLLRRLIEHGVEVSPRGQLTREILHTNHIQVDMRRPVVTSPARKLNYRFMAAEALWILSGSNELAPLTRFIKRFSDFSDDGKTLFGAYGPPITAQLSYVVQALLADRDTRQAVLTIWRQNPPKSKDIPCTIAMSFSIRSGKLHQHVYMRSSDAWLGVPYDMWSFAMVGLKVACLYNSSIAPNPGPVSPGTLTITPTSSHLYETNLVDVGSVLSSPPGPEPEPVPQHLVLSGSWQQLEDSIIAIRDDLPTINWSPLL